MQTFESDPDVVAAESHDSDRNNVAPEQEVVGVGEVDCISPWYVEGTLVHVSGLPHIGAPSYQGKEGPEESTQPAW